jgi:hypothetical protein
LKGLSEDAQPLWEKDEEFSLPQIYLDTRNTDTGMTNEIIATEKDTTSPPDSKKRKTGRNSNGNK